MKLEDLPDNDTILYPIPLTVRISIEAKQKLEAIKAKGKSKAKTLRKIIDDALKDMAV